MPARLTDRPDAANLLREPHEHQHQAFRRAGFHRSFPAAASCTHRSAAPGPEPCRHRLRADRLDRQAAHHQKPVFLRRTPADDPVRAERGRARAREDRRRPGFHLQRQRLAALGAGCRRRRAGRHGGPQARPDRTREGQLVVLPAHVSAVGTGGGRCLGRRVVHRDPRAVLRRAQQQLRVLGPCRRRCLPGWKPSAISRRLPS